MEPQSPPKRMTRSRAAAKANETALQTTKIVTAAAKAKSALTTTRTTTATKRKATPDDIETGEPIEDQALTAPMKTTRTARGRPKKVEEADDTGDAVSATIRTGRGRPKKAAQEAAKTEPTKSVRGRPKKVTKVEDELFDAPTEPPKKTTRTRVAAAVKPAVKKTVTFDIPEKENVAPAAIKDKNLTSKVTTTGIRAKPVRKAAATGRSTRGTRATQVDEQPEKLPLSPKKVTQMPVARDVTSEDELATMEKTPLRPSPTKPTASNLSSAKNVDGTMADSDAALIPGDSGIVNGTENAQISALASPAKRMAPSPFKHAMKSPAKRMDGVHFASVMKPAQHESGSTPFKSSLLQSPARRAQPLVHGIMPASENRPAIPHSVIKAPLFSSPAKRPVSPIKGFMSARPEVKSELCAPPPTQTLCHSTPTPITHRIPQPQPSMSGGCSNQVPRSCQENLPFAAPPSLKFPGRLSAVLPRHADPTYKEDYQAGQEITENDNDIFIEPVEATSQHAPQAATEQLDHGMAHVDADHAREMDAMQLEWPVTGAESEYQAADANKEPPSPATTTPPNSPPRPSGGMFGLREKDLNPYEDLESESEDELAWDGQRRPYDTSSPSMLLAGTPTPATRTRTPKLQSSRLPRSRLSTIGFTPLAQQFGTWSAASPLKAAQVSDFLVPDDSPEPSAAEVDANLAACAASPLWNEQTNKISFFEDEMCVRPDPVQEAVEAAIEADIESQMGDPVFDDIMVTDEDVALAAEANEMSLMEPEQLQEMGVIEDQDDLVSEASQEYADENEVPIDPALLGVGPGATHLVPPITPVRIVTRTFHTVSKVPLKAADESTPRPVKKRSHSISRLPIQRPSGLARNATVISYSPTKESGMQMGPEAVPDNTLAPPTSPAKSDIWSTVGTPARTPRKDVDPALLRGAVVFVDVHTTEGADASGIFVELLNQMGARCIKNWSWNPSGANNDSSKIGITHVVYKDGGKRTMEKVRESGGVVQCVGVSWVLDCERENKWLDEAPYYIDTSLVPRGGARRRKSMEPKALANLNGMLISSPVKQSRDTQTAPNTPINRRDSVIWMRTPPEQSDGENGENWDDCLLTPVPPTPAPEDIAQYAANITPETPSADADDWTRAALLTRTCPPKSNPYEGLGEGILSPEKDQQVLMRLMAARRKSLQFAPKVGSPLAKTWH